MDSTQALAMNETASSFTVTQGSSKHNMSASASACALSTYRRNMLYDQHRRSDSTNSSTSSTSSTSTAAGLGVRSKSANRLSGVSPSASKHHAAVLAAASLAAKRASMNGRPPLAVTVPSQSGSSSSFSSSSSSSSSSASSLASARSTTSSASSSSRLPSIPSIVMSAASCEPRPVIFEEEYQEEVMAHMYELQSHTLPNLELMNAQPELRWFMRPYLVDFIVEIHQTFRLRPETLYLTMNIVDRYVSKRIVFKRHYQLVGSAALLIAAKYEDAKDRVPTVADLCSMCCQAYDESAFIQMEGHILQTLSWQLGCPTPEAWLRQLCMQSAEDAKTQSVARFLMEDTLFHRDFIGIAPSVLASASLMLARYICKVESARDIRDVEEVSSVAQLMDAHISQNLQDMSLILIKKYSYQHFSAASTVVRTFYLTELAAAQKYAGKGTAVASLLPAHSLQATNMEHSMSSDSSVDDADCSMSSSGTSTPSSMASTPSRSTFGYDDDDEDDEDDDDMPVTPLSLTALHDPLASAAAADTFNNHPSTGSPRSRGTKQPHSQGFQHSLLTVQHAAVGAAGSKKGAATQRMTAASTSMKASSSLSTMPGTQATSQMKHPQRPTLGIRRNSTVSWQ
ncbi:unnamed protein product [Parajaminaea phylloscopi]